MSKIEKLIETARVSPDNLRFRELCTLCRHFGMKRRKTKGSHRVYKREDPPRFTLSVQDNNGMAKPYQVKQLLDKVRELGLHDFGEED
ncbi:MAG: type II toxin-antitoxin system HicA family toxin [Thermodesulfobacteriota bacterium]|nr:type II toxin-antitoxin system HicA family toxin [Thermodesulfobacteriota bacterium]